MQTVDLLILSVLILGGMWGLSGGVTRIFSPLALLLALTAALSVYPRVAAIFSEVGGKGLEVHAFAFLVAFLMALVVFGLINRAFAATIRTGGLGGANHFLGMIIGLALAAFLAGWAVHVAQSVGGQEVRAALAASQLAPLVLRFFETLSLWAERLLPPLERRF